jgi:hypothetical protein
MSALPAIPTVTDWQRFREPRTLRWIRQEARAFESVDNWETGTFGREFPHDAPDLRALRQRNSSIILDFQKKWSNYRISRRTVHSAMVASIASPIATRTLTTIEEPRPPIAHPPYDLIAGDRRKRENRPGVGAAL